ncbi:carbohydrate-binding family 9-like protein [Aquimarina longa]|uniref:carbohydrate-binding family 9-like protein n=1 Tax=Aquimarina longa TaxID=1080221 RepID=UPI0007838AF7|nr:carbohydrate-binding family 9-like protein [Aquimarina longa]
MKKIIVILLILSSLSCKKDNKDKDQIKLTDTDSTTELPVLKINKKEFSEIDNLYFNHAVGGMPIQEETLVSMKYDDDFLEIKFECRNNPRLDQNYYTKDNSWMFRQEVFELFISKGKEAQEHYIEIQLNPNNALFIGKVNKRYKSDNAYKLQLIDVHESGIAHTAEKDIENNLWKGYLKIPLKLLDYPKTTVNNIFRLNMFRVISNVDHIDKDWIATVESATFACWSSPMTTKPQFHAPEYFGFLVLE